ncbi:hypothetical protein C1638_020980 [Chryseobacterium oncorhynchi]|uniref:Uncharacterized protein n=1 Tax=Chryseobacterium oncorhynchi TaxID=741074 RepID=A0A316WF46_9FLAO|nr:hypothetical protein C1638_020980 [Chryseobacterium oncorhynchi]
MQPSGFRIRESDQCGQLGIFMKSPALFRKDPPGVERSAPADKKGSQSLVYNYKKKSWINQDNKTYKNSRLFLNIH